jgi:hypothetical protein
MAWARSAAVYNYIGIGVEARRRCEQALRLSPFDPHAFWTHCQLAITAYTDRLRDGDRLGKPRLR